MEALGINLKLLIAQIINFLILLFILWRFLYGPIVKMLEDRKTKIKEGMEEAEKARLALENATKESKQILSEATKESNKIVSSAKKQMEQETAKHLTAAKDSAEAIIEKAKQQATLEQEKIVTNAKKEIADLVIAASEKILSEKADKADVNKAIEAIK